MTDSFARFIPPRVQVLIVPNSFFAPHRFFFSLRRCLLYMCCSRVLYISGRFMKDPFLTVTKSQSAKKICIRYVIRICWKMHTQKHGKM